MAKLAAKHGLAFHVRHADVAAKARRDKRNLEDTARRERYGFFATLVAEGRVNRVAVAHTADDQAETVLAHILRGTGLAGLGGIHPVAEHIVRPLVGLRRAELRVYLRSKKQTWREDTTNRDTSRMRARIRKKLLPLIEKQFQPAIVEHLSNLAELARDDEAFLNLFTERRLIPDRDEAHLNPYAADPNPRCLRIPVSNLADPARTHVAIARRMVRLILKKIKRGSGQVGTEHVSAVLDLAARGENGKSLGLPGGLEVRRERDALLFLPERLTAARKGPGHPTEFEHQIDLAEERITVPIPNLGCVLRFRVIDWLGERGDTDPIGAVLDRDALRFPLVLRNWRPGDRLRFPGHQRARKLKRLLNERHISRWERNGWPVLTSGGVLAWARGFPAAAEFAVSERTRAGIVIAEEKLL